MILSKNGHVILQSEEVEPAKILADYTADLVEIFSVIESEIGIDLLLKMITLSLETLKHVKPNE